MDRGPPAVVPVPIPVTVPAVADASAQQINQLLLAHLASLAASGGLNFNQQPAGLPNRPVDTQSSSQQRSNNDQGNSQRPRYDALDAGRSVDRSSSE